ncbi:MAG TPA: hypothetical protein VGB54_01625 [Allosphingosinicella sp.]|jgi:hypothetical protein
MSKEAARAKESRVPNAVKFLIGLAAALVVGWVSHGPMGRGELLVARLESGLDAVMRRANVPGVSWRMQREPLARTAILSGPADRFQREGQGSLPGIDGRVLAVPGMGRVEWTNPPP